MTVTTLDTDRIYVDTVMAMADPDTGMLSPGDARRLLASHAYTWEDYIVGEGGGLADWPAGSRDPRHLLDFLGYARGA
jgi:hypothetical protein